MLRFVVCDDNKSTLDKTISILESIFINNDIHAEISFATTNAKKLSEYLLINTPDVVILDIDLSSSISGIELAKQIRERDKNVYIIFLTAHFEYSMLAYKVKTFDFLVKPITYTNFEDTVKRLYEDIYENKNCFVRLGASKQYIRADDILYIEKNKAKAIVYTQNSNFQIYGTFEEIKSCLPDYFVRCHKSFIINTNCISKINKHSNLVTIGNAEVSYSEKYITDERMMILNEGIVN